MRNKLLSETLLLSLAPAFVKITSCAEDLSGEMARRASGYELPAEFEPKLQRRRPAPLWFTGSVTRSTFQPRLCAITLVRPHAKRDEFSRSTQCVLR